MSTNARDRGSTGLGPRALTRRGFLAFSAIAGIDAAQAADKEAICVALKGTSPGAELYSKVKGGELKLFADAKVPELAGKRVHFFFTSRRGNDIPPRVPRRGAINVKIEEWEPDAPREVQLYNNHQDEEQSCHSRPIWTYQNFHEYDGIDACLRHRFHNPPGDFPTLATAARRRAFLFPTGRDASILNLIERIFVSEPTVIRRRSHIYNYLIPSDLSALCIHFYIETSRELSAMRITIDDLLENRFYDPLPRMRWTVK